MPDRSRMSAFSVAIGGLADVAEKWKNDVPDPTETCASMATACGRKGLRYNELWEESENFLPEKASNPRLRFHWGNSFCEPK